MLYHALRWCWLVHYVLSKSKTAQPSARNVESIPLLTSWSKCHNYYQWLADHETVLDWPTTLPNLKPIENLLIIIIKRKQQQSDAADMQLCSSGFATVMWDHWGTVLVQTQLCTTLLLSYMMTFRIIVDSDSIVCEIIKRYCPCTVSSPGVVTCRYHLVHYLNSFTKWWLKDVSLFMGSSGNSQSLRALTLVAMIHNISAVKTLHFPKSSQLDVSSW